MTLFWYKERMASLFINNWKCGIYIFVINLEIGNVVSTYLSSTQKFHLFKGHGLASAGGRGRGCKLSQSEGEKWGQPKSGIKPRGAKVKRVRTPFKDFSTISDSEIKYQLPFQNSWRTAVFWLGKNDLQQLHFLCSAYINRMLLVKILLKNFMEYTECMSRKVTF